MEFLFGCGRLVTKVRANSTSPAAVTLILAEYPFMMQVVSGWSNVMSFVIGDAELAMPPHMDKQLLRDRCPECSDDGFKVLTVSAATAGFSLLPHSTTMQGYEYTPRTRSKEARVTSCGRTRRSVGISAP
jgi:hypothetical protein